MNGEKMYMETKHRLYQLLNSDAMLSEFSKNGAMVIRKGCDVMCSQLDQVVRGRRIIPNDQGRSAVASATNLLIEKLVYEPISKFVADFSMLYAEIAKNWNQKIGYQYDMDMWVDTIIRLVQQHLTIMDGINVLRKLLQRCESLTRYEPPAFSLSKHYLQVINEEMKKGNPINEYEKG